MVNATPALYAVDVYARGRRVARWERFGTSIDDVIGSTRRAAQDEWPAEEIYVMCRGRVKYGPMIQTGPRS